MSYLSKDEYYRRELAAGRRMAENAEIDTLTPEQHEALATLCFIRHKIHAMPRIGEVLFYDMWAENDEVWAVLDTVQDENVILAMLESAGLPKLEWSCDPKDYDTDFCWPTFCIRLSNASRTLS